MCSCYECKVCNKKYNVSYKYIHQKSKLHRTNQKLFDLQKENQKLRMQLKKKKMPSVTLSMD